MLAAIPRTPPILAAALAAVALATLVSPPPAAALLASGAAVVLAAVAAASPRRLRWWMRTLAFTAAATLVAAAIASAIEERFAARAAERLEASHATLWRELAAIADAAVARLESTSGSPASQGERFDRLREAAEADADERMHLLLWDRSGDLDSWWGTGLLPDVVAVEFADRERGAARSALAATLHLARRFADVEGRPWTLVVAESFPYEGSPPVAHADRRIWSGVSWRLRSDPGDGSAPRWRVEIESGEPRRSTSRRLRSLASILAALLLATWAASTLTGAGVGAENARVKGRRVPVALAALGLAGSAALIANGCGASADAVVALAFGSAAAGALAALAAERPQIPAARIAGLALGAAAGPALLLFAASARPLEDLVSEMALGAPTVSAWRLALTAALLTIVLAGAALYGERRRRIHAGVAATWPIAAAVAAMLLVDSPLAAATALALAGGGAVPQLASWRRRSPGELLGALVLVSLIAAAGWSGGARLAEIRSMATALPAFLPPSVESVGELADRVERALAAVDPSSLLPPDGGGEVPEDLAYALWRDSPLASPGLLTSLRVTAPGGRSTQFSAGLPLDAAGEVDTSPTRWADLAPPHWLERRTGGETVCRDAHGRAWAVRWQAVPLPGFAAESLRAPRGAATKRAVDRRLGSADPVGRVVLYDAQGRVVRSPWPEGTPALTAESRAATTRGRVVATPDGPSFATARTEAGVTAVALVPSVTAWRAFERTGAFVAGVWVPAAGLALVLSLLLGSWSSMAAEIRLLWRSYSRRLVLVFTLLLLVPLAVGSIWVSHSYARRLERQQEAASLEALHSAQRILGEYVLSLEPGFGVGTAVDDRLLEWLARVVRSEVHLYWGSELYASSNRGDFAAGLRPTRIAGEIWQRIHLKRERIARRLVPTGGDEVAEIYAPLEIPGLSVEATKLVLALPRRAQQDELAAEIAGIRRRAFLTAGALAVLLAVSGAALARRFARPIEEIVRGTQRIADGAATLGYAPDELELEALSAAIDSMATKVAEARQRLLVEKNLVERIAENVTAAVVGLDAGGRVLFANRLAREMLHAAPGEALRERLGGGGFDALAEAFDVAAGEGEASTARVDSPAGQRDWTLVRVPLPGPGDPAELVVVEDVTDVVRAERLDAWAAMARIIAHEVKNPLTPIRLSAEHLREAWSRDREHFETVFDRCTANILRQVEELRRTASEFSLYSEIPSIELRRDDLREAIAEIVEAYRAAPPAGVEIVFDDASDGVPASFDRRLLGRAVRNLIENAVRASAGSGRVEVSVGELDAELAVRVADRGPGVPQELLSRVVEPYFSTQSGGTGLGLPIARRVAEEHGGSLTLRNLPSGGLEVTITIPRR